MSTTGSAHDASDPSPGLDHRVPPDGRDGSTGTADVPARRLVDRISEAVRAAHRSSVPF